MPDTPPSAASGNPDTPLIFVLHVPQQFSFSAVSAGFKPSGKLDLGLCLSILPATAAGVFTKNRFQAAPVELGREFINAGHPLHAVCINSGQANACTGEEGLANCLETSVLIATELELSPSQILPASTGVIGKQLDMETFRKAIPGLVANLGKEGPERFAQAIMTTDAFPKISSRCVFFGDVEHVSVLGIAKGAGMICPNMATMLALIVCDAKVERDTWQQMLSNAVEHSFNRITVDGDTSTNDTVYALANGASGIEPQGQDLERLAQAVNEVCHDLAGLIVADAEGGSKVITISVDGAEDDSQAENVARTVGHSPLVKTAFYGRDPNWGRIIAAIGRSQASYNPDRVQIWINNVPLFVNGKITPGDKDVLLAASLRERQQHLRIKLGQGPGSYVLRAADLTHDYVSLNADYTT